MAQEVYRRAKRSEYLEHALIHNHVNHVNLVILSKTTVGQDAQEEAAATSLI